MTVLMQQGLADDGGFAISWPEWKTATPTELLEQYEREAKKKVINGKGSDSRSLAELLDVFMEYPALSLLAFGGQVSEDQKLFLLQL